MPRDSRGRFCNQDGMVDGTYIDDKGYPRISAGPCRGVRVHTLVAEAMLKRTLEKWEDVHHKDYDKLNCRWTNLEVVDHKTHGYVSSQQAQYIKRKDAQERQEWDNWFEQESHENGEKPIVHGR